MPTNVSVEYAKSQKEYFEARTSTEKLAALKKMLTTAPKHKSAEKLNQQLKRRLADQKKEIEKEKKAGKGKSFAIKKEGAATIAFLGAPDSGKSRLFAALTNSKYGGENNYGIRMRMIPFENIWMQAIDLPAFSTGFSESTNAKQVFGLVRTADVILFVVNVEEREKQMAVLNAELAKANIKAIGSYENMPAKRDPLITYACSLVTYVADGLPEGFVNQIKIAIWRALGRIRVQTKTKAGTAPKPVVLSKDSDVKKLAETIHKDFLRKFKHAKVWGPSAAFAGQQVGLNHKLKDKDVVELFLK